MAQAVPLGQDAAGAQPGAREGPGGRAASTSRGKTMNETDRVDPALAAGNRKSLANYKATHFLWEVKDAVATITLNRPERKNPLTFDSYAELRDLFGQLKYAR